MNANFTWHLKTFSQLTTNELYDFLKLRIDVFVVEQTCYYSDLDDLDRDPQTRHLFAYDGDTIIAYCRVLAPDVVYKNESAIGRVIISDQYRGQKLAHTLMNNALQQVDTLWPEQSCHISAQQYLEQFYQSLGFVTIGDMYLEDGIPHLAMRRVVQNQK